MKILKSLGSNPWKIFGTLLALISVPALAQDPELATAVAAASENTRRKKPKMQPTNLMKLIFCS